MVIMVIMVIILLEFMADNFLTQIVDVKTTGENTLDLVLTNNDQLINGVTSSGTHLSDHNLVEISLRYNPFSDAHLSDTLKKEAKMEDITFNSINIHRCGYASLNNHMSSINWELLEELCKSNDDRDGSMFFELVRLTTLQLCLIYAPLKSYCSPRGTNKLSRIRKTLKRKRRKIESSLRILRKNSPTHLRG